jgi:UDP-N-acetyl-D-mannosaminuronic acid dehydrogenase
MTTNYDRAKDFPKPGFAAGPCLLKDTLQLSAFNNNRFLLGHAAMLINEGLPSFLTHQIKTKLGSLEGRTVGILGMAFKADIDDIRDALSFKLRKLLQFNGAEVLCSDEYVQSEQFISSEELIKKSEIIIVGVPHSAYWKLSIPAGKYLVDLWGVLSHDA